jgi:hypothetical protein
LQDWENVARDLQTLGFIPADAGDPVAMGMAEPLGKILVQLSGGGGASKLNIDAGEAVRQVLWLFCCRCDVKDVMLPGVGLGAGWMCQQGWVLGWMCQQGWVRGWM